MHLPFKGAPEAMTEVLAGRADFYFAPLVNALPLLKDGQLQALAVSGSARASTLPDVPTTVEAGYPNSEYNFWAGMFLPAKTPADIRARLYAETAKALQTPAVREKLAGLGADPMALTSAAIRRPGEARDRDQYPTGQGRRHQSELIRRRREPMTARAQPVSRRWFIGAGSGDRLFRPATRRDGAARRRRFPSAARPRAAIDRLG